MIEISHRHYRKLENIIIENVKTERDFYRHVLHQASEALKAIGGACITIYFLTGRKAGIFGICCEAIPEQRNFIIDEAMDTGKGGNVVVSMIQEHFGMHATNLHLNANNCVGQNKNNTVIKEKFSYFYCIL